MGSSDDYFAVYLFRDEPKRRNLAISHAAHHLDHHSALLAGLVRCPSAFVVLVARNPVYFLDILPRSLHQRMLHQTRSEGRVAGVGVGQVIGVLHIDVFVQNTQILF